MNRISYIYSAARNYMPLKASPATVLPDCGALLLDERDKIAEMLEIEHIPDIYICPSFGKMYGESRFNCHIASKRRPFISLEADGKNMTYKLAHEMYHQYDYEKHPDTWKKNIDEQITSELKADGFALAYIETQKGRFARRLLPAKIDHILYHNMFSDRDYADGVPDKVRQYAEQFKKDFCMEASVYM